MEHQLKEWEFCLKEISSNNEKNQCFLPEEDQSVLGCWLLDGRDRGPLCEHRVSSSKSKRKDMDLICHQTHEEEGIEWEKEMWETNTMFAFENPVSRGSEFQVLRSWSSSPSFTHLSRCSRFAPPVRHCWRVSQSRFCWSTFDYQWLPLFELSQIKYGLLVLIKPWLKTKNPNWL